MDFLFLTALRTVVANIFCGVLRHLLAGRAGGEVNKTTPAALPTRCRCYFEVNPHGKEKVWLAEPWPYHSRPKKICEAHLCS